VADSSPAPFRRAQIAGALFLALGATFGALGAHALGSVMTSERLDSWGTASLYLLVMGAGLIGASHSSNERRSQVALDAVWVGTVLFSCSIMGLVTLATLKVVQELFHYISSLSIKTSHTKFVHAYSFIYIRCGTT